MTTHSPRTPTVSDPRDMAPLVPAGNPPARTLADLRVGDEVVTATHEIGFHYSYRIRRVVKVTTAMIDLDDRHRYRKSDGRRHERWSSTRIVLDDDSFASAREQEIERAAKEVQSAARRESERLEMEEADRLRHTRAEALERVRAYLTARAFPESNQLITAIGGQQLLHDDLAAIVEMAGEV
jgi:hypothetical protein